MEVVSLGQGKLCEPAQSNRMDHEQSSASSLVSTIEQASEGVS
jgi:hypothetical protein